MFIQRWLLLVCSLVFVSCAGTRVKHVSALEFQQRAEKIAEFSSIENTDYIGASMGRVYLEHRTLFTLSGGAKVSVLWTELDSLHTELQEQLKTGESPWDTVLDRRKKIEESRRYSEDLFKKP